MSTMFGQWIDSPIGWSTYLWGSVKRRKEREKNNNNTIIFTFSSPSTHHSSHLLAIFYCWTRQCCLLFNFYSTACGNNTPSRCNGVRVGGLITKTKQNKKNYTYVYYSSHSPSPKLFSYVFFERNPSCIGSKYSITVKFWVDVGFCMLCTVYDDGCIFQWKLGKWLEYNVDKSTARRL